MATETQNHAGKGTYGGASMEPINYDLDTLEPDVYPGTYQAKCTSAKAKPSKKGKPMIELTWTMTASEDESEGAQKSIGAEKRDWIVFLAGRGGNFGKIKLRALRDSLGLDPDVLPTTISNIEDLSPLCQALKGAETNVWIVAGEGEGEDTQIQYTSPVSSGMAPMSGIEEEEEPEAPPARKAPAKSAPAKKSARR